MNLLPWMAMVGVGLGFVAADELDRPVIRRIALTVASLILGVGLVLVPSMGPRSVATAAGPLAFLLGAMLLRRAFRRWKGEEPIMAYVPRQSGPRPGLLDFVYSLLLGLAMLLAVMPAIMSLPRTGP